MCPSGRSIAAATESHAPSCFRSAFEVIDADRDGKIGPDDLRSFYGALADETAIETMISAADSNRDGFVEFDEFQIAALHGGDEKNDVLKEVFEAIDRDGDGKLGREDLRDYMKLAGFSLSGDDVDAMIALANGDDGDDGVTYQGWLKILAVA